MYQTDFIRRRLSKKEAGEETGNGQQSWARWAIPGDFILNGIIYGDGK